MILPVVIAVVSLLAAVSAAFIAWKYKDKLCAKRKVKPRAVQKKMNEAHGVEKKNDKRNTRRGSAVKKIQPLP